LPHLIQACSLSIVESNDFAFWIHLPQIGASSAKLERKVDPQVEHLRLYIFPFGFHRLKNPVMFLPFSFWIRILDIQSDCAESRSLNNNT
jgi:hypothetical protein